MTGRVGVSAVTERNSGRNPKDLDAEAEFKGAVAPKAPVLRESFVSSAIVSRQPPRLPLDDVIPQGASAAQRLFGEEIESLSRLTENDVAGDLAEIYLTHAERALSQGDPELTQAFETVGELMVNYEHLRLLRTGEMG